MKAPLYSKEGKKKGEVVLNPEIYGTKINQRLLQLIKNAYAANLRSGTASTKVHKDVRGGGKKPWKQKGTGRARQGSIRAAQWTGGGVVFGPHPRSYYVNLSKNMREQALISALSLKADQKNILLIEEANAQTGKTKEWAGFMKALPLQKKKTVCVVRNVDANLRRATKNMQNWVQIRRVNDLNAYDLLQKEKLLIEQEALPILEERLLAASKVES